MQNELIVIKGARVHNLKDIDVSLPRNRLIVVTGVSGSGKSSLAFDTIYAEGQRRYVESLSSYARQFLERLDKPDVASIEGLSPAISIEQRKASFNPRSTVGTQTEIYDYLRVLFARAGTAYCYRCGRAIQRQSAQEIVSLIMADCAGRKISILAPVARGKKGEHRDLLQMVRKQGFLRARIDGDTRELDQDIVLDKRRAHNIEVVIDRLVPGEGNKRRVTDSVEMGLKVGRGVVVVALGPGGRGTRDEVRAYKDLIFSERYACAHCGVSIPEIEPRMFSFNSPYGACPSCNGLGVRTVSFVNFSQNICPLCRGTRLKKESLCVKIGGKSICDVTAMSIRGLREFFRRLSLSADKRVIARGILREINSRLDFCLDVGLDYLSLDRRSFTLSGGEAQRIRLATQVGSRLVGVAYVLDEPSIGLHQRDNRKLLSTLKSLRDLGNTLIVVEHDEETIRQSDYVVDLGPGAGRLGGEVVFAGKTQRLLKHKTSLTAKYLRRELRVYLPGKRRRLSQRRYLKVLGCREHNLKNIDLCIPLGTFTVVSGVSGSGKSTFIEDILYRALAQKLHRSALRPGRFKEISGLEFVDKVLQIDQSPIGRTPRSNPATYTGAWTHIRELFSRLPEARLRGYKPGRFSFNVRGGRCEACAGDGIKKIEMHFLPDIYVTCDVCKGERFNEQTQGVRYKGASIADVLNMTVEEAANLFANIPKIKAILGTLADVGLGYIQLGQSATTLSGGEAQRIKLTSELSRRDTGRTVYILDEPTTGLHFADVDKLLKVLDRLVERGNTVVVVEHNLDVLKCADYIIDLGPEGGERGGRIVARGAPETVARNRRSHTGRYLRQALDTARRGCYRGD